MFSNTSALERLDSIDKMDKPEDRLGAVLAAFCDPFTDYPHAKPFNPVHGEWIRVKTDQYSFTAEMVSHHPPIGKYKMVGPSFTVNAGSGVKVDGMHSIKLRFNGADLCFPTTEIVLETKSGKSLKWQLFGYRIENLISSNRFAYHCGPVKIVDSSGVSFEGIISKNTVVEGKIMDKDQVKFSVKGNMQTGLVRSDTKSLWFAPLENKRFEPQVDEMDAQDALFASTIWAKTKTLIKQKKFTEADVEKTKVEVWQRERAKSGYVFKPRFEL
ncbi:hypothetical protein EDD86DRAFT_205469, partial [Gorgonomyces haynaldii]